MWVNWEKWGREHNHHFHQGLSQISAICGRAAGIFPSAPRLTLSSYTSGEKIKKWFRSVSSKCQICRHRISYKSSNTSGFTPAGRNVICQNFHCSPKQKEPCETVPLIHVLDNVPGCRGYKCLPFSDQQFFQGRISAFNWVFMFLNYGMVLDYSHFEVFTSKLMSSSPASIIAVRKKSQSRRRRSRTLPSHPASLPSIPTTTLWRPRPPPPPSLMAPPFSPLPPWREN